MDTEQLIRDVVRNVMEKLSSTNMASQGSFTGQVPGTLKGSERKVVCGVSVRHIHLCREDADVLFGKGYELSALRDLYNPGFAAKETLTVVGPKLNAIQNIRVLGPFRAKTQVELAKTDCIILGIDAPVRPSGETAGSSSAVLIGPKGAVYLSEGVIRANRHMHLSTIDAEYFGIKDNQVVDVRVGGPKGLTFNNVQVRVAPDFKAEFHVDTDDGNAADIINGTLVEIVDASCISPLAASMADGDHIPPQIPDGSFAGEVADTNLVKNICAMSTGKPCSQAAFKSEVQGPTKKTVITFDDLDNYAQTGIKLSGNVILSPLARDEAVKRGIKITWDT